MISVVITEVMQFTILTLTSLTIGVIAIFKVSPEMIQAAIPAGWINPFFGWKLGPGLDRHPRHRSTTPSGRTATNSSASSSA